MHPPLCFLPSCGSPYGCTSSNVINMRRGDKNLISHKSFVAASSLHLSFFHSVTPPFISKSISPHIHLCLSLLLSFLSNIFSLHSSTSATLLLSMSFLGCVGGKCLTLSLCQGLSFADYRKDPTCYYRNKELQRDVGTLWQDYLLSLQNKCKVPKRKVDFALRRPQTRLDVHIKTLQQL